MIPGLLATLCWESGATAQLAEIQKANDFYVAGITAYRQKDYKVYLKNMRQAVALWPDNAGLKLQLAGALARNGLKGEALQMLEQLIRLKIQLDLVDNPDLASLKGSKPFQKLLAQHTKLKKSVASSQFAFSVPQKDLVAEGIAYDPAERSFYISSVHRRKILRIDETGKAEDFIAEGQDGIWAVLALKVDPKQRILWALSSALPEMNGFRPEEKGFSSVYKYDLTDGKLIKKYLMIIPGEKHAFNDLALDSKGNVYISDTEARSLYQIDIKSDEISAFLAPGKLLSPQGLAFSDDEKSLYIADYALGIFSLNLATKELTKLTTPKETIMVGTDCLVRFENTLIALQNGIQPNRVVRLYLDNTGKRIERSEIIEMNNNLFSDPTLGVIAKDSFYYIANGQWSSFNLDGTLFSPDKLQELIVLKTKLKLSGSTLK
ncbi:MAG: SMP-30/gluconolactonase/LRE family protein [Anaerolineae bacterium]|nr:SMP-30/gluconolactonase/LRE family protein [Gloeobacterales cyanobacterium ES-bin-313]